MRMLLLPGLHHLRVLLRLIWLMPGCSGDSLQQRLLCQGLRLGCQMCSWGLGQSRRSVAVHRRRLRCAPACVQPARPLARRLEGCGAKLLHSIRRSEAAEKRCSSMRGAENQRAGSCEAPMQDADETQTAEARFMAWR